MATRVLLRHFLDGLVGLSPHGIGGAIDAEWADIESGQQVQLVQLRRKLKPSLFRIALQMPRRRRAFLGACRLGRLARRALAGIALQQAQTWMFRRRTGHKSLLCGLWGAIYHGYVHVGPDKR